MADNEINEVEKMATAEAGFDEAEVKSEREEPTVGKYSQEDMDRGIGKGLTSVNRQLTLAKQRADKAEADLVEARDRTAILEKELDEKDPGVLDFLEQEYAEAEKARDLARRELGVGERAKELEQKAGELEEREKTLSMVEAAKAVMRNTGVPLSEIEGCKTPGELGLRGAQFKAQKLQEALEEMESSKEPPVIDSGISTGRPRPNFQATEKAYAEGRVSYEEYAEARKQAGIDSV